MEDRKYWLWFTRIEGIGLKKLYMLLENNKTPKELFYMEGIKLKKYFQNPVFKDGDQERFFKSRNIRYLLGYEKRLEALGIGYSTIEDKDYPSSLLELYDPPMVLYYIGDFKSHSLSISVVGARKCTAYGRKVAEAFGYNLAKAGVNVISGLARGIDSEAHKGALKAGGFTTAILGCGINICYPREHIKLMQDISKIGCIISEYGLDVPPRPGLFPMRNRIISGLSQGVLVVEAKKKSGSLITVDAALEGGKDIFAIPGDVLGRSNEGSNNLIKLGAKVVFTTKDILEEYLPIGKEWEIYGKNEVVGLEGEERRVYDNIGITPIGAEELMVLTGIRIEILKYILLKLEIKEVVLQLPGSKYIKNSTLL